MEDLMQTQTRKMTIFTVTLEHITNYSTHVHFCHPSCPQIHLRRCTLANCLQMQLLEINAFLGFALVYES